MNETLKTAILWIKARGCEWSTIRGIVGLIAGGFSILYLYQGEPDKASAAFAAGTVAIGFINTIRSENKNDKNENVEQNS